MARNKPNFAKVKPKIINYMLPRKYILHFKSSLALIGLAMLFSAFLSAILRFVSTPPTEEPSTADVYDQSAPMRVLWVRSPRPRLRLTTNELSMLSAGTMR